MNPPPPPPPAEPVFADDTDIIIVPPADSARVRKWLEDPDDPHFALALSTPDGRTATIRLHHPDQYGGVVPIPGVWEVSPVWCGSTRTQWRIDPRLSRRIRLFRAAPNARPIPGPVVIFEGPRA